jgi:MFS family permease
MVIWITWRYIKEEWADAKGEKFDLGGSILYVLSMSAFMYGFSRLPEMLAIVLVAFGLLGLIAFVILEMRLTFPVFNMRLLSSNRLFALSNVAALINYATTFAITFLLSLYLQYILGMSPRDAGMILITQPVMMAIVASISGKLSDTYDPRLLASAGMTIIVVGLIMLTFLTPQSTLTYLVVILASVGVGFGMFSSPNTNAIMGSVHKKYLGLASATVGTMRLTGQMMSMGIATLILQLFIGNNALSAKYSAEFMTSMKTTFLVFVILCVVGVFASLARGKSEKK